MLNYFCNLQESVTSSTEVGLAPLLVHLSFSLDFSRIGLLQHHERVALLALHIGKEAGLEESELSLLFKAAIVHDAGAVTWAEKASLHDIDIKYPWPHCQKGCDFISRVSFLKEIAPIVLYHHDAWAGGNPSGLAKDLIPLPSRIIHLADRIAVLINDRLPILQQVDLISEHLYKYANSLFDPDLLALVANLAKRESFWLDLVSPLIGQHILKEVSFVKEKVALHNLSELAGFYARIVDAKSPFTHRHSMGVALVSRSLAELAGLGPQETSLIYTAGLLHDLGKLSVPEEIIEKPGPLTRDEYKIMKQHTYYTFWALKPLFPTLPLAEWAAYHHERLDGEGYPFRKKGQDLDMGARILAVADIFTALREERPYRSSLSWTETERIICNQVRGGALDGEIAGLLLHNKGLIQDQWTSLTKEVQEAQMNNI